MSQIKNKILEEVEDKAYDFLYYDRKECEYLPMDAIENAIKSGEITLDEIVDKWRERLQELLDEQDTN